MSLALSRDTLLALAELDTCSVANAIESFDVRLRNEGYTDASIHCRTEKLPPLLGYAMTLRVRSAGPAWKGGAYLERSDWWSALEAQPLPHVLVVQDVGRHAQSGAFLGEIHAAILKAFGSVGAITNGAVRDLPAVEAMGFHLFSAGVAPSHGYAHIVEVGGVVDVGGLQIAPGDLLHGDRHGVVQIPLQIAERIPEAAARLQRREREVVRYCQSPEFSREGLLRMMDGAAERSTTS